MSEKLFDNPTGAEPEVSVEGEPTTEERVAAARKAIEEMSLEGSGDEKFPGADAYRKVMAVALINEIGNDGIAEWEKGYEHWNDYFDDPEGEESEAGREQSFGDLKRMLEEELADAEEKLTVGS